MAQTSRDKDISGAKRLMAALGRMPPKPHEKMKLGKRSAKTAKSPRQKRRDGASAKPKNA